MSMRLYFFYTILIVGMFILLGRLFELQVIRGGSFRAIAEGNRIRKVEIPTTRGIIYDRQGRQLTRNIPLVRIAKKEDGQIIGWEAISRQKALEIEVSGKPESLREDVGRQYLFGPALASLVGYLGEANQEEVESGQYEIGDLLGRTGVEQQYDSLLRGQKGGEIVEVNAQGNKVRDLGSKPPVAGQDLHLSVDGKLSQTAYGALEGKQGAVIVSEARTGQILVLVSSPSYDPNLFIDLVYHPENQKKAAEVLVDTSQPMFNRAIGANYPPGSTFKLITSVAGLEENIIDRNWLYTDTGQIKIGDFVYNNWYFTQYGRAEGEVNVVTALKRSTDTFFYKLGEKVGPDSMAAWARKFGLGAKTGIDLPGEVAGYILDPQTKKEERGESWFLGNTYHFAIGQGYLLTTPLQVNVMTQAIANGGKLCKPKIIDYGQEKMENEEEGIVSNCTDLGLKAETLNTVIDGMKEACLPRGTAYPFFEFQPQVACKTGTAEFGEPKLGKTHAWFTAFAPADDPEVVITAIVEGGGEGSAVAAPIAKKVLEEYFKK